MKNKNLCLLAIFLLISGCNNNQNNSSNTTSSTSSIEESSSEKESSSSSIEESSSSEKDNSSSSIEESSSEEESLSSEESNSSIEESSSSSETSKKEIAQEFLNNATLYEPSTYAVDDDGNIIQNDNQNWTQMIVGGKDNNNFEVFEFDINPAYLQNEYSSITLRFRAWDTSNNYAISAYDDFLSIKKLTWSSGGVITNTLSEIPLIGIVNLEVNHVKIMCCGWVKTVMINDHVVCKIQESDFTVGQYYIESWQTAFTLSNFAINRFESQDKLLEKYPEVFSDINVSYNDEMEKNEKLGAVLEGKYLSILGDSISTFDGYCNDTNVNTTLKNNSPHYTSVGILHSADRTYWKQLATNTKMNVLVDNAWAGSKVVGWLSDESSAANDRAVNLHANTGALKDTDPDIILVYMGTNDFDSYIELGSFNSLEDIYDEQTKEYKAGINDYFTSAYAKMLHKIVNRYPNADVFCLTLLPNLVRADDKALNDYNNAIKKVANYFNVEICDLQNDSGITRETYKKYTNDNAHVHPNALGMDMITKCLENTFEKYYLK